MYALDTAKSKLSYSICGTLSGSSGCYASGPLGTFGQVGAMIEGAPTVNATTHTVTREVYIVDQVVGGGTSTAMRLYDYRITEVVNAPNVSVTVARVGSAVLPMTGGSSAKTYLAARGARLYVSSSQSPSAATVSKTNMSVSSWFGFNPPINASLMSADQYGYVTWTFGDTQDGLNGFYVMDPTGMLAQDGGGPNFMLGTTQGLSISDGNLAVGSPAAMSSRVQVHLDTTVR